MKTASGLEYIEIEAGMGAQAESGKTVHVHYTGKFQNGQVFDSSIPRGEPLSFQLGAGRVIKGWDEGIALMKVGGKAQLIIPPHLGYGERGAGGVIPPNATLVFDVELVDVGHGSPPWRLPPREEALPGLPYSADPSYLGGFSGSEKCHL